MSGREYIMDMHSADGLQLVLRHDVDGLVWKFFVADDVRTFHRIMTPHKGLCISMTIRNAEFAL